jgi:hypothetical protein
MTSEFDLEIMERSKMAELSDNVGFLLEEAVLKESKGILELWHIATRALACQSDLQTTSCPSAFGHKKEI